MNSSSVNKTKDWALVQTAALVTDKGVEVRLSLLSKARENNLAQPNLSQDILS